MRGVVNFYNPDKQAQVAVAEASLNEMPVRVAQKVTLTETDFNGRSRSITIYGKENMRALAELLTAASLACPFDSFNKSDPPKVQIWE